MCVIGCLLAASPANLWAQAQPAPLFVEVNQPALADAAPDNTLDRTAVRSRAITIDFSQLADARSALDAGSSLVLNLFPDATYTAVLDRIDRSAATVVWVVHIPGVALSTVTLGIDGGAMYGAVHLPDATFVIRPIAGAVHAVTQVDQRLFPADGPEREPEVALPDAAPGLQGAADPAVADDGSLIDVMVLYTPAAMTAAGGATAMNALIANAISTSLD